jgi:TRAP-type C4-dicarboxylate transport system substrate-binding protein
MGKHVMINDWSCWRATIGSALAFSFVCLGAALAGEVKLATTQINDPFVSSVRSSKYLQDAGITVVIVGMPADNDVLDALVNGSVDLGLFELGALSKRKFDNQPQLYTVFTRPFLFTSASEIVDVQKTPLGDAVLSDISRAGILPLGFWNRGLSQIWTKQPVYTVEHFRGLTVADSFPNDSNGTEYREREVLLTSLGAKPTRVPVDRKAEAFEKGQVGATVWEPRDARNPNLTNRNFSFTVYATEFQPEVGVFAGSFAYWDSLSESAATAWKKTVREIDERTSNRIRATDAIARKNTTLVNNPEREKSLRGLASAAAVFDQSGSRLNQDFGLLDEAKAFIRAKDQAVKKSRTEFRWPTAARQRAG